MDNSSILCAIWTLPARAFDFLLYRLYGQSHVSPRSWRTTHSRNSLGKDRFNGQLPSCSQSMECRLFWDSFRTVPRVLGEKEAVQMQPLVPRWSLLRKNVQSLSKKCKRVYVNLRSSVPCLYLSKFQALPYTITSAVGLSGIKIRATSAHSKLTSSTREW